MNKLPAYRLDAVLKLQVALSEFLDFIDVPGNGFHSEVIRLSRRSAELVNILRRDYDPEVQVIHMIAGLRVAKTVFAALLGNVELE